MGKVEKGRKRKRKSVIITLALLMLFSVFVTMHASAQAGCNWYQDDEFGYNISYPENWSKSTLSLFEGQEAGIRFSSDKQLSDGESAATIRVKVFSDPSQAKWWENKGLEDLEEEGVVIEHGEITVNDTEGYDVIYHPSLQETPLKKARWVVFDVYSNYYVIDCQSYDDLYGEYNNTFDTVIKSFTISTHNLTSTTSATSNQTPPSNQTTSPEQTNIDLPSTSNQTTTNQTSPSNLSTPEPAQPQESRLEINVDTTGNASFLLTEQYTAESYINFRSNYSEESAGNVCSAFGLEEVKNIEEDFNDIGYTYKLSFDVPCFTTETEEDDVWSSTEINLKRPANNVKMILPEGSEIEKAEDATVTNNVCAWTATEPTINTISSITYTVPASGIDIVGSASEGFQAWAQEGILIISKGLLYPVIIILFILIVWSLIALGCFLYEWYARDRDFASLERCAFKARTLLKANESEDLFDAVNKSCSTKYVHDFLRRLSEFKAVFQNKKLMEVKVEKLLQEFDADISKRLEKARLVTRAGPMLGLMGTLIPMGPALLALAEGNIEILANNLIIAFGSTVLGLAAGLIGYTILIVRTRWYDQDMSDMEYLSEILFGESEVDEGLELVIKRDDGLEKEKGRKLRQYLNKVIVRGNGKL